MDLLKNRVVQGAAVVGLLVGLGILLFKKDKVRQPVRPLKRDVVESDKNDSEALSKSQCGVNRIQQQKEIVAKEKLSDGQISDLLQEIAIQAQKYLWTSEKENIFRAHESKGADFKEFVEKLRDILLNQEAEVENFINRQKELLKSEGVNSEIITAQGNTFQAKINQFLTNNTNENHKELARVSITEKTNYLKKNGQQIINNINKACQEWKEEHLRYIPFVLNLIVTEEVYYKNTELTENSMQISWAIKKYANELAEQLVAWDNTVGDLLGNLNPQILKA